MSRFAVCAGVLVTVAAWAQRPASPVECDDNFAECKEDCAISLGGTTNLKSRAKLTPCLKKCSSAELGCRETFFETKRNNLDEGAISGNPTSRDVDADGLPTKTAAKKETRKPDRHDEELREAPAPIVEKKKEPEPKPAYELKKEEVPKSNRSEISKVEPKPGVAREEPAPAPAPAPAAPAPAPAPAARKEEPPKKKEPEPKKKDDKKRALDEWDPDAL